MTALYVFIGGGIGSLFRFGISSLVSKSSDVRFPFATFISNFLACLLLLVFIALAKEKYADQSWFAPLLITGLCGGFSTFSTFSYENYMLFQQGNIALLLLNVSVSLALGFFTFYVFLKQ